MNGGVRLVPRVMVAVVFRHEMNQPRREDFNPLATEFDVEFVLFPEDPSVALHVQRGDWWMVTHLGT